MNKLIALVIKRRIKELNTELYRVIFRRCNTAEELQAKFQESYEIKQRIWLENEKLRSERNGI